MQEGPAAAPSVSERTPLLPADTQSRPPSYTSRRSTSDGSSDHEAESPEAAGGLNKVSRTDLIWILLGLWSAVFLGALDGAWHSTSLIYSLWPAQYSFVIPLGLGRTRLSTNLITNRNYCRNPADTDWLLLRKIQPGVIHRLSISPLCMLLYASLWSVRAPITCTMFKL